MAQGMGAPGTGITPPMLRSLVLSSSSASNGARRPVAVPCSLVARGLSCPEAWPVSRRGSAGSVVLPGGEGPPKARSVLPGLSVGVRRAAFPAGCGEHVASLWVDSGGPHRVTGGRLGTSAAVLPGSVTASKREFLHKQTRGRDPVAEL